MRNALLQVAAAPEAPVMRVFHVMLKGTALNPLFHSSNSRCPPKGLADDVTDDSIAEHFAKAGPVLKVRAQLSYD